MKKFKIVIAGGSGYLGTIIAQKYYDTNSEVIIFTRRKKPADKNIRYVEWDATTLNGWTKELEESDVVINLTGKSVNCRYTRRNKEEIIASRVNATLVIGRAIQHCTKPPKVWINAGSAAIFGNRGDTVLNELSSIGEGFSADVCKYWEEAFHAVDTPHTRKVLLRVGLVYGKKSWVFTPFITMVRLGLGGTFGKGDQYVSWIHQQDFLNLPEWGNTKGNINGVLHAVSPFPVTNEDLMKYPQTRLFYSLRHTPIRHGL